MQAQALFGTPWLSRLQQLGCDQLLVAYSGGLDSRCLLQAAVAFVAAHPAFRLTALHVHHGLNPAAEQWVSHCQQVCAELGVALRVERVQLSVGPRQSLEAVARSARYQVLARHMSPTTALLTAHHLDDQLETLLLALKRGAGPRGLGAMAPEQPFASGMLLRPLLHCSRQQLEQWAQRQGWQWIEDDSNQDQRFDRNFLRHSIVPPLVARWPGLAATAARSAELCREQESLLAEIAAADLALCLTDNHNLQIEPMLGLSEPRRHNLLRHWLRQRCGQVPSAEQLRRIWPEVVLARADATPALVWAAGIIRRYAGQLWLTPAAAPAPIDLPIPDLPLHWQGECGELRLQPVAAQAQLRQPGDAEPLSLRFAQAGSLRVQPLTRAHSRELKKIWHEYGVAPWLRDRWPLLFYGEQLAAIPGLCVCRGFAGQGAGLALSWQPRA